MSLQLWLPLTKDSRNYGTANSNVTVNNATVNTNGKLGSCYSFNGTNSYFIGTHNFITNNLQDWTFSCWMKLNSTSSSTGQTLFSCRTSVSSTGITVFYYGSQWYIDDGARWQFTPTVTIAKDTWYHVCVIRKKGVGKYLYINGVLDSSTATTGTPTIISTTNYAIGASQNTSTTVSGNWVNGYLNDIRFYDHAISMAELKEISKGLAVHYKLDEFYSSDNLIVNGFGELGTENWSTASYISTTEIPPNHPEIKASVYSGNSTKTYIPIIQNHSYTMSGYIKQQGTATTNTYPSLFAYDIDKKQIQCHHTKDGFANAAYITTLSQPLHKGDTVIHATDLSAWTTADTNHYFHVAIFGYKDSRGYVYPDMFYTQDSPSFGSKTDKSNIDKTNNTITLLSAFTGEDRPAGTTICQSTEGATYYYPWGGINPSTVTDWTFKTKTFKPNGVNRFKAAAYIRWSTYGRLYVAGSNLVDNTACNSKITDSSGYGNNGIRNGNISISYSSPRYDISTVFDGTSSYINIVSGVFPAIFSGSFTISLWVYNSDSGDRSILFGNYGLTSGFSLNIEKTTAEKVRFYWNGSPDVTFANSVLAVDEFTLLTITRNGNTVKSYINGVLKDTSTASLSGTVPSTSTNFRIGTDSRTGATMFKGRMSDFRLYATELSAEDVLALYNVGAKIANDGSMLGYQMKES